MIQYDKDLFVRHLQGMVQIPTVSVETYTYDGTAQGPAITRLDAEHCTVTNATKTDAGTYTLTIALNNTNTMVWSDLTNQPKTFEYTIQKATVTVPTVSGSFTYDGTEKTATIGSTGDYSEIVALQKLIRCWSWSYIA